MTAAAQTGHLHSSRPIYALTLRLGAMVALAIMFACVKWASERGMHLVETLFYRQLFSLPIAVMGLLAGPGLASLRTPHLRLHAGRTLVGTTGMVLNFLAVILLPLAEATTIGFSVPLFATVLSIIFLGERPGKHRWAALITGFIGVVILVGPGSQHAGVTNIGLAVAVAAAIVTSFVSLLLRQLGRIEEPANTVFWFAALSLAPLACLMPFFARGHDPLTWAIVVLMGLSGGLAQLLMTSALRWGSVSLVLPMDYSSLLWSTALGWLLWNTLPGPMTWLGAALIAASGIHIAWRERLRHRETVNRAVPLS